MPIDTHDEPVGAPRWFVIWTSSRCERLIHEQLLSAGFESFLPSMNTWSRRRGVRRTIAVPMFAGYVFVRFAINKRRYIDIIKIRGVVRLLGEAWDRLTPVPDEEIATIRRIVETDAPVFPYPYLREGQHVRIADGPLEGIEGVLVRSNPRKGLLVVSVGLLQRSVAVEVDAINVVPASSPGHASAPPWSRTTTSPFGALA